jgi:hypothetical protein
MASNPQPPAGSGAPNAQPAGAAGSGAPNAQPAAASGSGAPAGAAGLGPNAQPAAAPGSGAPAGAAGLGPNAQPAAAPGSGAPAGAAGAGLANAEIQAPAKEAVRENSEDAKGGARLGSEVPIVRETAAGSVNNMTDWPEAGAARLGASRDRIETAAVVRA